MNRYLKLGVLVLSGASLLQFGGCVAAGLVDVLFAVAPLLL
jgi:hypothetical protein